MSQKPSVGAMRAATMIYDTHKLESMTMPCFGLSTDEYIQNIATMIDQQINLSDLLKVLRKITVLSLYVCNLQTIHEIATTAIHEAETERKSE